MMEKLPRNNSVEIHPIPFQKNIILNDQLDNTGKSLVELQPKLPLHYVV